MNKEFTPSHSLTLENRNQLILTGVTEVMTSDDKQVLLKTSAGKMKISGSSLSIGTLNIETGELSLSGNVRLMEYKDSKSSGGFFESMFK